jgi:DNA modification methylase
LAIFVLQQASDPNDIVLDVSEQSHDSGHVAMSIGSTSMQFLTLIST